MIDMYDNPLHPPTPSDIEYFYEEDVKKALETKRMHFLIDKFLFYASSPYQTPNEKQLNWNTVFKELKHVSNAIISLRRKLHVERSRPTVTEIGYGLELKARKDINRSPL